MSDAFPVLLLNLNLNRLSNCNLSLLSHRLAGPAEYPRVAWADRLRLR